MSKMQLNTIQDKITAKIQEIEDLCLEQGELDPLEAYVMIHQLHKSLEASKERLKEAATNELRKHGKSYHDLHGHRLEVASVGARYEYKKDDEWCQIKEQLKAREEYLKAFREGGIDEETGELIERMYIPGKETIRVSKIPAEKPTAKKD